MAVLRTTSTGRYVSLALLACASASASAQSELYSVPGPSAFANLGRSVDAAGDVDGDGSPDWIAGGSYGARVHSGPDGALLRDFPAPPGNTLFGWSVAGVGDVNLDGFADVLVGAQLDGSAHPSGGRAWLFSGGNGGLIRTHDGGGPGAFAGSSMCGLSDVDGDGHPDYAVGAPGEGVVRVYSGRLGGMIVDFAGPELGFGGAIDSAGDVDGDGVGDVLVGIIASSGTVRVYSAVTGACVREISGADVGVEPGDHFGSQVAGLGDLDGDGHAEFAASSYLEDSPGMGGVGRVRIFDGATGTVVRAFAAGRGVNRFGRSLSSAGDVDGDGVPDMIVGAPSIQGSLAGASIQAEPTFAQVFSGAAGRLLYTYAGAFTYDGFGDAVVGIGDVDGDGLGDVAVGASNASAGANGAGQVRVFGGAGCPQPRPYCTSEPHSYGTLHARIGSVGSTSYSSDDLLLYVVNAGPSRPGAFVFGGAPAQVPAGDGWLCVGGMLDSFGPSPTNVPGIATLDLAPIAATPFAPGQTVFVQYLFRDVGSSSGAGFNGSGALAITFCP